MTTLAGLIAVVSAASAFAQEEPEGQAAGFPEGVEAVELHAVDLIPETRPELGRVLNILNASIDPKRGRDLHYGLSQEAVVRLAASSVRSEDFRLPLATSSLTQASSSIRVGAASETKAGQPLTLHIESVGTADAEWSVYMLLPDPTAMKWDIGNYVGARQYDKRAVMAGRGHGELATRFKTVEFPTYRPDAGRLLGILIEQVEFPETRYVFWVQIVR